jgi:CDP-glucose 4,6-dehydratase
VEDLAVTSGFWQGKKVFLSGHTGFKGAWLSLWLQRLGADIVGYALPPPTNPSLYEIADVERDMHVIIDDIRHLESLQHALDSHQPQIVIHMAAQSLVRDSYTDPVGTFNTNVMGTVHVLEAARHVPTVKVVLNVTSDKCYENQEWFWGYREQDRMGGHDPYSSSKACAELVTTAYRKSFEKSDFAIASARAGNVIGGGDWARDRLVPDAIRAFMSGTPLQVRNPDAQRPWQHVLDPLSGYLKVCEALWDRGQEYAGAWNFGPRDQDARKVSYVANALANQWGNGASWVADGDSHPHEALQLKLDCSKAAARLNWTPRWDLDQALTATSDWYQAFCNDEVNMRDFTLNQIAAYEGLR